MNDTLEAQARELVRQGCHHTDSTANRCRICLAVWARRLVAESRAGALREAEAHIAEWRRDDAVLRGIIKQARDDLKARVVFVSDIVERLDAALASSPDAAQVATQTAEAMPEGWRETARELADMLRYIDHLWRMQGENSESIHSTADRERLRALLARPEVQGMRAMKGGTPCA